MKQTKSDVINEGTVQYSGDTEYIEGVEYEKDYIGRTMAGSDGAHLNRQQLQFLADTINDLVKLVPAKLHGFESAGMSIIEFRDRDSDDETHLSFTLTMPGERTYFYDTNLECTGT